MGETPPQIQPRRRAILEFVADRIARRGAAPTIREIGAAVGLSSTSAVNYHLNKLRDRGLLVRDARLSRGMAMTPAGYAALDRLPPLSDAVIGRLLRELAEHDTRAATVLKEIA